MSGGHCYGHISVIGQRLCCWHSQIFVPEECMKSQQRSIGQTDSYFMTKGYETYRLIFQYKIKRILRVVVVTSV
jgi:hypothetical protein